MPAPNCERCKASQQPTDGEGPVEPHHDGIGPLRAVRQHLRPLVSGQSGERASIGVRGAKEDSNTEFADKQSHREPPRNHSALCAQRLGSLLGGSRWLLLLGELGEYPCCRARTPVLGHSPDCPALGITICRAAPHGCCMHQPVFDNDAPWCRAVAHKTDGTSLPDNVLDRSGVRHHSLLHGEVSRIATGPDLRGTR